MAAILRARFVELSRDDFDAQIQRRVFKLISGEGFSKWVLRIFARAVSPQLWKQTESIEQEGGREGGREGERWREQIWR